MIHTRRFCLFVFLVLATPVSGLATGTVEVWGGQVILPPDAIGDVVKIASSGDNNLVLKADGSLLAWGNNGYGQCGVPVAAEAFVDIAAGFHHSLAVTESGTIAAWGGNNGYGEGAPPLDNSGFTAVAAGAFYSLGLKDDGTIVGWGFGWFDAQVPPEPNENWVAIAAFGDQSVGLKADGSVYLWGEMSMEAPEPNSGFVAIDAGYAQALALRDDGSIVHMGINYHGSGESSWLWATVMPWV